MKKRKVNMGNMYDYTVGIDIGEKDSIATCTSPSGDIIEQFTILMNLVGYREFSEKIPSETTIASEASRMAYVVLNKLRSLGYDVMCSLFYLYSDKRDNILRERYMG